RTCLGCATWAYSACCRKPHTCSVLHVWRIDGCIQSQCLWLGAVCFGHFVGLRRSQSRASGKILPQLSDRTKPKNWRGAAPRLVLQVFEIILAFDFVSALPSLAVDLLCG